MAKPKTIFSCTECGGQTLKWQGQCPHCNAWNTLVESIAEKTGARYQGLAQPSQVQTLGQVNAVEEPRRETGIGELDRVLGGGLVTRRSNPARWRSRHRQIDAAAAGARSCCRGAARRCTSAVRRARSRWRCARVGWGSIAMRSRCWPRSSWRRSSPRWARDSPTWRWWTRSRPCTRRRCNRRRAAWRRCASAPRSSRASPRPPGTALLLVGHVTKEGAIAGPRVLEHMVDSVLYFEGDTHSSFRLVRATKNRFGAVNELGVFAMTDKGLRGVTNPSALFLSQHGGEVAGSCVLVTQEGTRPLLVEIQALVDESHAPNPRRLTVGLEQNRLAMLLAVLHRHAGVAAYDQDVFVNAVGGVKIDEPAADLAILLAIVSSLRSKPLPAKLVVFGEVGLAGEVRPVQRGQERLREAAKLGFTQALIPRANAPKGRIEGLEVLAVDRVEEAVRMMRDQ